MTAPMDCQLIGRWRIVEADIWERDYLDLVESAMMIIGADGHGEIAFGAMQASLDLAYGRSDVSFTWAGFDEMDEASGTGSAELLENGTLEIEFDYHRGDEATLRAEPAAFFNNLLVRVALNLRSAVNVNSYFAFKFLQLVPFLDEPPGRPLYTNRLKRRRRNRVAIKHCADLAGKLHRS